MKRQAETPVRSQRTRAHRGGGGWRALLLLAVLAGLLYLGRSFWLPALGHFLIKEEVPEKADMAVVLAGDGYGRRILRGVELAQQGYAPRVLVDGPAGYYDSNEADLAVQFAVNRGARRDLLIPMHMKANSTMDEAKNVDRELRRRGAAKVLVVTSNYHTRRAGAVFRKYGSPGITYRFVAAPDEYFNPDNWWRSREAQKVLLIEYLKLFAWWARI
jgi:uncharacterized SAM-binding protein YcdF (DUF218 family)